MLLEPPDKIFFFLIFVNFNNSFYEIMEQYVEVCDV